MSLPPLPAATMAADPPFYDGRDRWYTAEQMRDYARAAVAAEREACAAVCADAAEKNRIARWDGEAISHEAIVAQQLCAAAIRARGDA